MKDGLSAVVWMRIAYSLAFVRIFVSCHSDDNRSEHPLPNEALGSRHPVLDTGVRMKAPSYGNVAAYDWIPCQARDDGYREPHLEEGALINQENIPEED